MGGGDDVMMNLRKAHDSPLVMGDIFTILGFFINLSIVFSRLILLFFFFNSSWSVFIGSCVACAEKI